MGMGGDGNETLWGRVGMELKTMGTGGDGCNLCPRAHLYANGISRPSVVCLLQCCTLLRGLNSLAIFLHLLIA